MKIFSTVQNIFGAAANIASDLSGVPAYKVRRAFYKLQKSTPDATDGWKLKVAALITCIELLGGLKKVEISEAEWGAVTGIPFPGTKFCSRRTSSNELVK